MAGSGPMDTEAQHENLVIRYYTRLLCHIFLFTKD